MGLPHPYGQERWANGVAVTDFGFTSQRNEASFGLMDYNAQYCSPVLGRFVSPDFVIPEPSSSSGFNRYRYVRNNPLKYTDPTGHQACGVATLCREHELQMGGPSLGEVASGGGGGAVIAGGIGVFALLAMDVVDFVTDGMIPQGDPVQLPPPPGYAEGELNLADPYQLPPTTLDVPEVEFQLPGYSPTTEQSTGVLGFPTDAASDLTLSVVTMASVYDFKELDSHYEDHGQWYWRSAEECHQAAEDFILSALGGAAGYEMKNRGEDLLVRSGDWFAVLHAGGTIGTFFESEDMDEYWDGK